jgi:predicted nucleic acid-binding protein
MIDGDRVKTKSSGAGLPAQSILLDANVLINFIYVDQLDLLGKLNEYQFFIPEHVVAEITRKNQAALLKKAIGSGILEKTVITDIEEIADYSEFHKTLGQGESACLSIALNRGYSIASDEKGLFRRIVIEKIGRQRLVTTPDLILTAIRANLITVAQADKWKERLETHRFKMKFESFNEYL